MDAMGQYLGKIRTPQVLPDCRRSKRGRKTPPKLSGQSPSDNLMLLAVDPTSQFFVKVHEMSSMAGNEQERAVRVDADEFAHRVLDALATSPTQVPDIPVNEDISQNKVRCIVALVCNRLGSSPYSQPVLDKDTTYQWAGGLINIRNCANNDRPSNQGRHWTNITLSVAERLRGEAAKRPVAYLLSSWHPAEITRSSTFGSFRNRLSTRRFTKFRPVGNQIGER